MRPRAPAAASCAASIAPLRASCVQREGRADADRHCAHDTERGAARRDRAVRPDRRRQDRRRASRSPRGCARAASARSPSPPTRCRSTRGLEILTGVADRRAARELEHRLVSFLPVDARFSVAEYAALAHAEIDALLAAGATPIVVGGTGLYLRAALTELALRPPPPPGVRERWNAELARSGAAGAARAARAARAVGGGDDRPRRPPPDRPRARARRVGALEPPPRANRSCGPHDIRHPTRLVGLVARPRRALRAHRAPRRRDGRRRRARGGARRAPRRAPRRRRARRSASTSCWPATSRR